MSSGNLDTSFGTNGKVIESLSSNYIVIQSVQNQNGKILVAGYYYTTTYYLFLARYNLNGTIDTTFGINGYIMTNYEPNTYNNSDIMIVQSTNKIIILCKINSNYGLVRYNIDGTLDTSFGTSGIIDTGYTFNDSFFCSLKKQINNDKFVLCFHYNPNQNKWCLKYFNPNGDSYTSLIETVFIEDSFRYCYCNTIDNSGNVILAGRISGGMGSVPNPYVFCIYDADGNLNTNLGIGGSGIEAYVGIIDGNKGYTSVIIDNSNNIILAGDYQNNILINKYDINGTLLETNTDISDNGTENINLLLENNKIITSIGNDNVIPGYTDYYIKRINSDFTIDTTFGDNGTTIVGIANSSVYVNRIIEINGKIIATGYIEDDEEYQSYIIMSFGNNQLDDVIFHTVIDNNIDNKSILLNIFQSLGHYNINISDTTDDFIAKIL
jgi:uncharacterized delta-60 repeat protein